MSLAGLLQRDEAVEVSIHQPTTGRQTSGWVGPTAASWTSIATGVPMWLNRIGEEQRAREFGQEAEGDYLGIFANASQSVQVTWGVKVTSSGHDSGKTFIVKAVDSPFGRYTRVLLERAEREDFS